MANGMITSAGVDCALGAWRLTQYEPPSGDPLASALKRVWLFNGTTVWPRERVFPSGTLEIVLQLDATYRPVLLGPADPFAPLSVGGMRTGALTIEGPGRSVRVLGMELRPGGAFALLRTSLSELTDNDFDLHDVLGRSAAELGERCTAACDDRTCVAAALHWARAQVARGSEPATLVRKAVAEIEAGGGEVVIEALEALSGASRWRFAAAFRDQVGVSPKRLARILRFRRALDLVQESDLPLGAIAAQAGYYDQPHMNAEFKVHAGMTPRHIRLAQRYPNSASLAEQFFQDEVRGVGLESMHG